MTDPIRVLIADDHTVVRSGVRLLLEAEPGIVVVGEALDGQEAVDRAGTLQPDVVLMDIAMPRMDGLEATRQIKARWPHIHVLVLTMIRTDEYFFEMLKAGASGYVIKSAETGELIDAVRIAAKDEVYLYPTMARRLVRDFLIREGEETQYDPSLSPREQEILRLLAAGYSNKEIAKELVISLSTVYTHRGNLMSKLGLSSRRELMAYARQNGLLHEF
jgi:two-component system response regulator NreC